MPYTALPQVEFIGPWLHQAGHAIAVDPSAELRIHVHGISELFGRFVRHDWSGKIKVSVDGCERNCFDLFSPYRFEQCIPLASGVNARECTVQVKHLGRNAFSKAEQIVFVGALLPRTETAAYLSDTNHSGEVAAKSYYDVQVGMVDNYVESLVANGIQLEAEAERRWSKYKLRYGEMLVYAKAGDHLLDIGAGFLRDEFVKSVLLDRKIEYWVQDIDHRVVTNDQLVFERCGIDSSRVRQGVNSELKYPDGSFDIVFSSHCLEHSDDIGRTFVEIRRVLRPTGILFFAVPLGYDDSLEHSYAIDPDGWYALAEDHGFSVINQHIGNIYPEGCHDLVIVARRD